MVQIVSLFLTVETERKYLKINFEKKKLTKIVVKVSNL